MPGWSRDDVRLSLRRYLALALGSPPWDLRLERREAADRERPFGVVELGESRTTFARTSVPSGPVDRAVPATVTLYPAFDESEPVRAATRRAGRLAGLLADVVERGVDAGEGANGRPAAGPFAFPLWDYSEAGDSGAAREPAAVPYDRVGVGSGFAVRDLQDPVDPLRWTVVADLPLVWSAPGSARPDDGPVVVGIPGTWAGETGPGG